MAQAQQSNLGFDLVIPYRPRLDRQWCMVMIILRQDWNLRQWYDWLEEEMHLQIGRDYEWAWKDNCWAIRFHDPRIETMVRLKAQIQ